MTFDEMEAALKAMGIDAEDQLWDVYDEDDEPCAGFQWNWTNMISVGLIHLPDGKWSFQMMDPDDFEKVIGMCITDDPAQYILPALYPFMAAGAILVDGKDGAS